MLGERGGPWLKMVVLSRGRVSRDLNGETWAATQREGWAERSGRSGSWMGVGGHGLERWQHRQNTTADLDWGQGCGVPGLAGLCTLQ